MCTVNNSSRILFYSYLLQNNENENLKYQFMWRGWNLALFPARIGTNGWEILPFVILIPPRLFRLFYSRNYTPPPYRKDRGSGMSYSAVQTLHSVANSAPSASSNHNNETAINTVYSAKPSQGKSSQASKFQTRNASTKQVLRRNRAVNWKGPQATSSWEGSYSETSVTCTEQALEKIEMFNAKRI